MAVPLWFVPSGMASARVAGPPIVFGECFVGAGDCHRQNVRAGIDGQTKCAVFEAVHGSAPDIAGRNIANPTAVLQSAVLMLKHMGERETALKVQDALERVYRHRKDKLTKDVGGPAGTQEFADAVIEMMETPAGQEPHVDPNEIDHREIMTGEHCFGCTAGAGSSCGGALV